MGPANKSEENVTLSIIISNQTSFIHSFTQLNACTCTHMHSFLRFLSNCKQLKVAGYIVQFHKISILPPQKGLEFPGGWGVLYGQEI